MKLERVTSVDYDVDLIVYPFWKGEKGALSASAEVGSEVTSLFALKKADFLGKEGEQLFVYSEGGDRLLLLGLGARDEISDEKLRKAYAAAVDSCRSKKLARVLVVVAGPFISPVVEGLLLANYAFDRFLSEKERPLIDSFFLLGVSEEEFKRVKGIETVVQSVNYARDLVNGNGDDITPRALAREAFQIADLSDAIRVTVMDKERIEKAGMGLLLAVSKGALEEPRAIFIEYRGDPSSSSSIAFVGKGITYDTGGLNLKPTGSMETMKCDMAGAATVLALMRAVAQLGLKVNLLGAIAASENGIGPGSYKPGDVYKSYSGKSVEITNTDAEGRLVLADIFSYIQDHYSLSMMVDLATLTGGIVAALGEAMGGLFSNDEELARRLIASGERTGELLWRMPLYSGYKESIKSPIADLKNCADRKAPSSIVAALFLEHFVGKNLRWAHLDIAGTAYLSAPDRCHPTRATGVGVQLLIDFLRHL